MGESIRVSEILTGIGSRNFARRTIPSTVGTPARKLGAMARAKALTREQLQARKEKAERFTRDVRDDPDRADEIAGEDLESYAARRKIQLVNPHRRKNTMARQRLSREELEDRVAELQAENEDLQSQLEEIADIVSPDEENDDDQD